MFNHTNPYRERNSDQDDFTEFLKGFQVYEKVFLIKEKSDLFLDAYSQWLKTKDESAKLRAMRLALELELLGERIDVNKIFVQNTESRFKT